MSNSINGKCNVSGFTFIKNGLKLGYPIKESIESIEPLCDEIVINVGFDDENLSNDDGTYEYLRDNLNHSKYVFLKSHWNSKLDSRGLILSEQTNIALAKAKGDICQYIQGDEVVHEDDLSIIHDGIIDLSRSKKLQGLVFDYIHFYGNVDLHKYTRSVYRREVRTIKNRLNIKSWLDAQGFRHQDNSKLVCKRINARIFHYGWARKEKVMENKIQAMEKLYHGSDFEVKEDFNYQKIWGLKQFEGVHPSIMGKWIQENRNEIDILKLNPNFNFKHLGLMFSDFIEKHTGFRLGEYKNYKLLR